MTAAKPRVPGVLVVGDINVDILARIEAFPAAGEDCLVPELELHCGGVGANTAMALAHWGVPVRLCGTTGRDSFGELALGFLRRERIDVSLVRQSEHAATGLMFIAVSPDGQRTIFGSRGANTELVAPMDDTQFLDGIQAAHLMGYNFLSESGAQVAERLLSEVHRRGGWVSLDVGMAPSHQIPEVILQAAAKVDILFVSQTEATALTGQRDNPSVFGALETRGVREVVMKLGEQGCLFRENGILREAPSFAIAAADSTGAGDAFAAGFIRARLRDWPVAEAALLANASGAAAASVVGAGERMPAPPHILRVLRANRLATPWDALRICVLERLEAELGLKESAAISGGRK